MKFLCLECDEQMRFAERRQPGDGTFAAAFHCPKCGRSVALLANPMETQLVSSLGVKIGGRTLDRQPMELARSAMLGREDAFDDVEKGEAGSAKRPLPSPLWSPDAQERLERVPNFVRGMVKKIYGDYAKEHGLAEITPEVMDRARVDLGLEGF
ncbi:MAG: PCP reductase family protein [Gemmatimonadales bacterium]